MAQSRNLLILWRTRPIPCVSYSGSRHGISARRSSPLAMRTVAIPLLGVELPWLDEVVRARRPERLPVVLTRDEVRAALGRLDGPARLMACLLYGAGLRVLECCRLRVQEEQCAQRLVLGGRGDVTVHGERRQEPCDLRRAHLGRVPLAVKEDVSPDPADVCVLGAAAVVASADGVTDTVEQAGLGVGRRRLMDGAHEGR